jgi:hypothetical protein
MFPVANQLGMLAWYCKMLNIQAHPYYANLQTELPDSFPSMEEIIFNIHTISRNMLDTTDSAYISYSMDFDGYSFIFVLMLIIFFFFFFLKLIIVGMRWDEMSFIYCWITTCSYSNKQTFL